MQYFTFVLGKCTSWENAHANTLNMWYMHTSTTEYSQQFWLLLHCKCNGSHKPELKTKEQHSLLDVTLIQLLTLGVKELVLHLFLLLVLLLNLTSISFFELAKFPNRMLLLVWSVADDQRVSFLLIRWLFQFLEYCNVLWLKRFSVEREHIGIAYMWYKWYLTLIFKQNTVHRIMYWSRTVFLVLEVSIIKRECKNALRFDEFIPLDFISLDVSFPQNYCSHYIVHGCTVLDIAPACH